MYGELTLREALAVGLLERFVRQEESRGSELTHGSQLERALALLVTQRRLADEWSALMEPRPPLGCASHASPLR
jgi:hypothetical protein